MKISMLTSLDKLMISILEEETPSLSIELLQFYAFLFGIWNNIIPNIDNVYVTRFKHILKEFLLSNDILFGYNK